MLYLLLMYDSRIVVEKEAFWPSPGVIYRGVMILVMWSNSWPDGTAMPWSCWWWDIFIDRCSLFSKIWQHACFPMEHALSLLGNGLSQQQYWCLNLVTPVLWSNSSNPCPEVLGVFYLGRKCWSLSRESGSLSFSLTMTCWSHQAVTWPSIIVAYWQVVQNPHLSCSLTG